jgi:hypothetical protein
MTELNFSWLTLVLGLLSNLLLTGGLGWGGGSLVAISMLSRVGDRRLRLKKMAVLLGKGLCHSFFKYEQGVTQLRSRSWPKIEVAPRQGPLLGSRAAKVEDFPFPSPLAAPTDTRPT